MFLIRLLVSFFDGVCGVSRRKKQNGFIGHIMGSRTVTSVDDIRFTMRLHEFYDQVGLSRVVSSLLSGNAGDETHLSAFHSYFLTFHLLSFLFLSFDTFDTLPSFHHIISFSFFINL